MSKPHCEQVLSAALARMDGEVPPLSEEEIQEHLVGCQVCRAELKELTSVLQPLSEQERCSFDDDLWPDIEARLLRSSPSRPEFLQVVVFVIFGTVLLALKLLEVTSATIPEFIIKLTSVIVTVALFCVLRQNPFRIREHLSSVGGSREHLTKTMKEDHHVSSIQ